jgi:WD40 repeat protein
MSASTLDDSQRTARHCLQRWRSLTRAFVVSTVVVAMWSALVVVWQPPHYLPLTDETTVDVLRVVLPSHDKTLALVRSIPASGPLGTTSYLHEQEAKATQVSLASQDPVWRSVDIICLVNTPEGVVLGNAAGELHHLPAGAPGDHGELLGQQVDGPVSELACSVDGCLLVSMGVEFIYVWDLPKRKLVNRFDRGPIFGFVLSPDGQRMYCRGYDVGIVERLTNSGEVLRTDLYDDCAISLASSPDGKRLAVQGTNGRLTMLELPGGNKLWERRYRDPVASTQMLSFSPQGDSVLAAECGGGRNGWWTLYVWDARTGSQRASFGTPHKVLGATFASDQRIISWGAHGTIQHWNLLPPMTPHSKLAVPGWAQASLPTSTVME